MPIIYIIATLLMMLSPSAGAAEPEKAAWKQVKEYEGIIGYARSNPRCRIDEIKAVGIIDAPLAVVEAVIRDVPNNKNFMFMCKETSFIEIPDMKNTPDKYATYALMDMPFPVNDREAVACVSWTVETATGTLYAAGQSLATNYRHQPGVIRIPLVEALYTLKPIAPDRTEVTYQAMSDPGGNLPAFLVSILSHDLGVKTIAGIRKMAKQDKYRQATIVTTTAKR
ncbi:MAG: START domain-containing protein [Syntrophaceae bacterium]